jgi:lambda family phage portal protein
MPKKGSAAKTPRKSRTTRKAELEREAIVVSLNELPNSRIVWDHGEKFAGGLGPVDVVYTDYWALRARSAELYQRNLYARGLIRRLISNQINTGLHLESTPEEKILGVPEDSLSEWSEDVENRFALWGNNPYLCDQDERRTFGALQEAAQTEALVSGDVLVVLRNDQRTRLPRVKLISGSAVQTPWGKGTNSDRIKHGVELDAQGRHAAYWVLQEDDTFKRLPAYGEKSGRRIAWLHYGCDNRLDDVRGMPLLGLVLQSLKEIDRYRDASLRKAVINSMLAMFVSKGENLPGTKPLSGGATRKGTAKTTGNDGKEREFRAAESIPGLVIQELQFGEKPEAFKADQAVDGFGVFEKAIVQAIAWANEIPPEILTLSFGSNYSASQAAINEFKMYLNRVRTRFGENFCSPIYEEYLLGQVLSQRIEADGFVQAFRSLDQFEAYGAWISCDWSGAIKPAVDLSKLVRGYREMQAEGYITADRASRELTGTKWSKNIKKRGREIKQWVEAMRPLLELAAELAKAPQTPETMRARKALSKTLKGAEKAISLCG